MDNPKESLREEVDGEIFRVRDAIWGECHLTSWTTCGILLTWAEDQSVFISTRAKNQTPVTINIGCYLALAATCLSCPLKTYLRRKTKMLQVKVRKLYYFDPKKPMPVPIAFYPAVTQPQTSWGSQGLRSFSIEMENLSFRKVVQAANQVIK
jgi:hypothetical protein